METFRLRSHDAGTDFQNVPASCERGLSFSEYADLFLLFDFLMPFMMTINSISFLSQPSVKGNIYVSCILRS